MITFGPEKIAHEVSLSGRVIGTLTNKNEVWVFAPDSRAKHLVPTSLCSGEWPNRRSAKSAIRKALVEEVESLRKKAIDEMLDKAFPEEEGDGD